MRVLHVTSALDPVAGGIATAVARLAESQADAGLTVRIFSTWVSTPGNDAAEQLRQRGVHVQLLQCRDPRSHHRDLPRLVSDEIQNVDLVHVHGMWEEVQYHAGRIALGSHRPYVMTPHGMIAPWCMKKSNIPKRIYLRLRMRKNLNAASAIHYTSDAERDLCASLNLSAPTLVEPNGLDLSEFKSLPARGEFRRRRPEIGQRPVVLSLGRLSHKKGLDLLIPAFARANIPDALLVLAGPDEDGYQRQLESLAADNGIGDRVIFTGM
ncbi:MAG TPA: glycosyltransferase, partial [Tepidisphaeraceae bacterium]|nr:glycosyltransferase [Tepidisphaeraceae bacterium]